MPHSEEALRHLSRKDAFLNLRFDFHPSKADTELSADIEEEMIESPLLDMRPHRKNVHVPEWILRRLRRIRRLSNDIF